MPRPICMKCCMEMFCVKNEVLVKDEGAGIDESGHPATYWLGDQFECPVCLASVVTGFGAAMDVSKGGPLEARHGATEFARGGR